MSRIKIIVYEQVLHGSKVISVRCSKGYYEQKEESDVRIALLFGKYVKQSNKCNHYSAIIRKINFQRVIDTFTNKYLPRDIVLSDIPVSTWPPEENKNTSDNSKIVPKEYDGLGIGLPDDTKIVRNAEKTECAFVAVCVSIGLQRSYKDILKEKVPSRRQNSLGISLEPYSNSGDLITMANLLECRIVIDEDAVGLWRRIEIIPIN